MTNGPVILKVHHAQITIPNGTESSAREFYCDFLGIPEISKPESLLGRGGFWLELGTFQVHVGTEDNLGRNNTKAHLAYEVNDLSVWHEKLSRSGIEITEGVQIPHFRRFEFRDPFGNRVEFLERHGM